MKKAIIILLCFASCATSNQLEGDVNVPRVVEQNLSKFFPQAKHISWVQEGADYEASFSQKGETFAAVFEASGKLKETERIVQGYTLPSPALNYVRAHYPNATIDEAAEIIYADSTMNYEAQVNDKDLIFDDRGRFIRVGRQSSR